MDIQVIPLAQILPYAKNPKKHKLSWIIESILIGLPEELRHSDDPEICQQRDQHIIERLVDQPIVVDENMVILKGHGRHEAAKQLGLSAFPVYIKRGLSEVEKKKLRIADNRSQGIR